MLIYKCIPKEKVSCPLRVLIYDKYQDKYIFLCNNMYCKLSSDCLNKREFEIKDK